MRFVHPGDLDSIRGIPLPHRSRETLTVSYRLKHGDGHYVWLEVVTRAREVGATFLQKPLNEKAMAEFLDDAVGRLAAR